MSEDRLTRHQSSLQSHESMTIPLDKHHRPKLIPTHAPAHCKAVKLASLIASSLVTLLSIIKPDNEEDYPQDHEADQSYHERRGDNLVAVLLMLPPVPLVLAVIACLAVGMTSHIEVLQRGLRFIESEGCGVFF